jgi:CTP:molybdopterin cytidylyltransferase MocA
MTGVCGVVLAAGAGTRFGGPKALARTPGGTPWLARAVEALRAGGCDEVVVVLGAGADAADGLVPADARLVVATDWQGGLSRSLTAGLHAVGAADRIVIVPVDTPDLPAAAVSRVLAAAPSRNTLARATYRGRPGHPVVIGAAHLDDLVADLVGDSGAGHYLDRHGAGAVECGDLWSGRDLDRRS